MPKSPEQPLSHDEAEEEANLIQQSLEKNQQPSQEGGFSKEQYQEEAERVWAEGERIQNIIKKAEKEIEELFENAGKEQVRQKRKEKSIQTADETTKELIEHYESIGVDWNDAENIRGLGNDVVRAINELFGNKYGLSVPDRSLPMICTIDVDAEPCYIKLGEYIKDGQEIKIENIIGVPMINDIINGNAMSEEMAHFYRYHFEPEQPDDDVTGEFFGFLGKKLWQKVVTEEELEGWWFLAGHEEQVASSTSEITEVSKLIENHIKELEVLLKEADSENISDKDKEKIKNEIEKYKNIAEEERRQAIIHHEGYGYADKIDIDKIHDWKKLFSLSNQEVRRRFFTPNPDYLNL